MLQSGEALYIHCLYGKGEYPGMLCFRGVSRYTLLGSSYSDVSVLSIQDKVRSQLGLK